MATLPDALLLGISSPYARRGVLWDAYRKHFAQDSAPVLVWQAPTQAMHPGVAPQVIADAYETDEAAASAEYGGQFRRDIESFVSREAVEACVIPERRELQPSNSLRHQAFVDASGGSQDSMSLALGHWQDGKVLDAIRERRPPFSPSDVVAEFADLLKTYHVASATGDAYAGEWPRERFREHGIAYNVSTKVRSDLHRDLLPLLNSGTVELLDHKRVVAQLCALERRTARSGKDSIDHAPGGHDDVANAVAGVVAAVKAASQHVVVAPVATGVGISKWRVITDHGPKMSPF